MTKENETLAITDKYSGRNLKYDKFETINRDKRQRKMKRTNGVI